MSNQEHELPPVAQALQAQGIPFRIYRHAQPIRSLAQAVQERGQRLEQVVRSLLFRLEEKRFVLVLVPGGLKVDWGALRRHLGVSRITTATPEEAQPVRLLADPRIFEPDEVSIGSGVPGVAIILRSQDLRKALGSGLEILPLGKPA